MEWITDERRPEITKVEGTDWSKSRKIVILTKYGMLLIAEYNKGDNWEQWYSLEYDDAFDTIQAWCDCIPEFKN